MRESGLASKSWKRERLHALRVQQRRGALHLSGRDDAAIGDEQRARERQLARELAERANAPSPNTTRVRS
jgi:hypothetical protein